MNCSNLVAGCFGNGKVSFAQHKLDAERAVEYLKCCVTQQRSWTDVEKELRDHLESRRTENASGYYDDWINQQIARAQRLMLPWLNHNDSTDNNVVRMSP